MSIQRQEPPDGVVKFAPKRGGRDNSVPTSNSIPADDAGNGILALLHKAAEGANEDCARAMDLARKLSVQLRDAEQRAQKLEAEANHFRERAATAENWLMRIHSEVEQTFFQRERPERARQGRE
jgi:hypothetical protein